MAESVVCAHGILTPQNVAYETERLIAEALFHRRPVYMGFPADYAVQPVLGSAAPIPPPSSEAAALEAAVAAILEALGQAGTACALPGILVARCGLQPQMQEVIDRSGLPFATMFMDKSVLDERQAAYAGMYDGAIMTEEVRAFVEGCDQVLAIGTLASDFNTGAFTARLDPAKTIAIGHHHVRVGRKVYANVELGDVLAALAERLDRRDWPRIAPHSLGDKSGQGDDPITVEALYPRWAEFLQPCDVLIAETGTASMGWALREALVSSTAPSLTAVAAEQGVSQSYAMRLVRFAWLAPDIVEAILGGCQPANLTASRLMQDTRIPTDWQEQRQALGFV